MARIRTVKPDFWGSAKTAKVSRSARLLFLGLLNEADDDGRLLASTAKIAGNLFPHDSDVAPEDVAQWLVELASVRFVELYTVDGIGYCSVRGFGEHQRVSHPTPSKFPEPPGQDATDPLPPHSGAAPEILAPEVEQGTGNRGGEAREHLMVHDLLAPNSEPPLLEEVEQVLAEFTDRYPVDDVAAAVQRLVDDRRRFVFPSKVRTALAALLGPAPAQAQAHALDDAQRAQYLTATTGLPDLHAKLTDPEIEATRDESLRIIEANRAARKSA